MAKIQKIGLGTFIRSARRTGKKIGEELDVAYSDLAGINEYLSTYSGFFESTYSDASVDPNQGGINGENILVSNTIDAGTFFNVTENRPKTIKEVLTDIRSTIDITLGASDVSTELLNIKDTIGANVFDAGQVSADPSMDKRIEKIDLKLTQMAADCFNRDKTIGDDLDTDVYQTSGEGGQTQANSLRDLIEQLLVAHGGLNNLGHSDIGLKTVWALNYGSEVILGGDEAYSAPFGVGYSIFELAQKFYNPMDNAVRINKLYIYIDQNSLADNLTVTVYKNGNPTDMVLHVAGGRTGSAFYLENEIVLEPNSYIQFKIQAGNVNTGTAHINNISLTIQEII